MLAPCLYLLRDQDGRLIGLLATHVDDIVACGSGMRYQEVRKVLQQKLRFGKWELRRFKYTGREIKQLSDLLIEIQMDAYADAIEKISISKIFVPK